MKRYILILVSLLVLCVGCSTPTDPMDDTWTENLYPAINNTYDIGSTTLQYQDGYFVNLHISNGSSLGNVSIGTSNVTYLNVLNGGQVRAWDAANLHSVWLRHDGTNGILQTDFSALYLYSPTSTVGHLGDSAGLYEFQIEDSGNARVAAIDSDGNIDAIGNITATNNVTASYFLGDGSQLTGITNVYHNEVRQYNAIIWTNSSVTSSGIATFYPTDDGTSGGTALFTNIYSVQALAVANTTTAVEYPFSSLKSISIDKKTIQVNVGTGTTMVLLGSSVVEADDGTQVYITVIGN